MQFFWFSPAVGALREAGFACGNKRSGVWGKAPIIKIIEKLKTV